MIMTICTGGGTLNKGAADACYFKYDASRAISCVPRTASFPSVAVDSVKWYFYAVGYTLSGRMHEISRRSESDAVWFRFSTAPPCMMQLHAQPAIGTLTTNTVYVSGQSSSGDPFFDNPHPGTTMAVLVAVDAADGSLRSVTPYSPDFATSWATDITVSSSHKRYVAGYTRGHLLNGAAVTGTIDGYVMSIELC